MRRDNRTLEEKIADRNAKIDALHEKLTSAVESLVTGDDWRRAIEFAARFRSRSFNNTLLIWVQHAIAHAEGRVPDPVPTYVAGFQQWRQLGRQVMKGQSGYQILAPVTARMASFEPDNPDSWRRLGHGEKPSPGEVVRSRMVGIKPAYVWDISMTQGPPIAELSQPKLLTGQAPAGMWDGLAQIVAERGFTLHDAPDAGSLDGANGVTHWIKGTVHVRLDMDDAARARTLSHEVGHIVLHDRDNVDAVVHRGIAEVEAESVALMIGAAHGMDTTQYTIPYVSTWASRVPGQDPIKTIQDTAGRVRTAALGILERLDTLKVADGNPPGLDHELAPAVPEQVSAAVPLAAAPHDIDRGSIAMDQPAWCGKELAHIALHDPFVGGTDARPTDQVATGHCRGDQEVEAESVAYLVATVHGIDTAGYSFDYLAGWASSKGDDVVGVTQCVGARVVRTAHDILDRIGTVEAAHDGDHLARTLHVLSAETSSIDGPDGARRPAASGVGSTRYQSARMDALRTMGERGL